jgi:hypothetical protein
MVFAKAVADINVDVLYYKIDQNNRKIFWLYLPADIPRQTDRLQSYGFMLKGSRVLRARPSG